MPRPWRVGFSLASATICLVFAIQIPSPLRINPDAVTLLHLASRLTDHQPYLQNGSRPVFPIGTPLLFSAMERLGIANSRGFIILNILCLIASALASTIILRSLGLSSPRFGIALILAFSSFILLKHALIPLSDVPYMAASLAAVAAMESASRITGTNKILQFIAALILAAAAISLRRIGIALVPACVFVWMPSRAPASKTARIAAPIAFVAAILLLLRHDVLYTPDFAAALPPGGLPASIKWILHLRFLDLGEVLLNVPYAKLSHLQPVIPLAGAALLGVMMFGIWQTRKSLRPAHIYLIAYTAILFLWPYGDNRFWLPVLPLIAAISVQAIEPLAKNRAMRILSAAYVTIYVGLFLIAAVYTTRVTYSKHFPQVYADGKSSPDYAEAWSSGPITTPTARIIRRYSAAP